MPADDFWERMLVEVLDPELRAQLVGRVAIAEVGLEALHAVRAEAVVAVEVVADVAVHAAPEADLDQALEPLPPLRIVQAAPVLLHAADGVTVVGDRFAVGVALEQ